ncbi:MAG TPA: glycosyltransferase family 4 protein [Candidatus Angelobacter sp.]|jgi:glycosyltransferase involved in cell wall biosynthesis|nr:glycosyltransferase family 4 protein [Candidatus Angelobacter sp.]
MRILVVTQFRRKVGGIETYLATIVPALNNSGHELGICYEFEGPQDREPLEFPGEILQWPIMNFGKTAVLAQITCWHPDLVFCHGFSDLEFESQLLKLAPGIFYAHNYHGTCVSGTKTRKFPTAAPCSRTFGLGCLFQYYPRRCGGLNPATMLKRYKGEGERLRLLRDYAAIVTNSEYLAREYRHHGLNARCLYLFTHDQQSDVLPSPPLESNAAKLLFVGRMDRLKGGQLLLEALPEIRARVGRDLQLTFIGDGPDRGAWQKKAEKMQTHSGIRIEFRGWLTKSHLAQQYADADLLVVPSLWPEPFGLVGIEAGFHGLPAVAFSVGGIPEWLHDSENGYLAQGDPPTPEELARASAQALDPKNHQRLRVGAKEAAQRWTVEKHYVDLNHLLQNTINGSEPPTLVPAH